MPLYNKKTIKNKNRKAITYKFKNDSIVREMLSKFEVFSLEEWK